MNTNFFQGQCGAYVGDFDGVHIWRASLPTLIDDLNSTLFIGIILIFFCVPSEFLDFLDAVLKLMDFAQILETFSDE